VKEAKKQALESFDRTSFEVKELDDDLRRLKSKHADACMIQEKLEIYVREIKCMMDKGKVELIRTISDFLARVDESSPLKSLVKFHMREQGHRLLTALKEIQEESYESAWDELQAIRSGIQVVCVNSVTFVSHQLEQLTSDILTSCHENFELRHKLDHTE